MTPSHKTDIVRWVLVALVACSPLGCGPQDALIEEASEDFVDAEELDQGLVTPVLVRHTIGSFSGVGHFGADSVPRDDSFIPPNAVTASGKRPTTSILWNWTGNTDSPAGPGAFSTGAERNEKAIGGNYVEGGVYWYDFWVYFDPSTTNPNVVDWNYIMQHRSNGATPSPSPNIGILGANLILRRNITGVGAGHDIIGSLDEGGGWHHYQVGYRWSVSASVGWVEAWRDGVNVLPRKSVRTAFDTSNGATVRFGGGYRTPSINGPVKYWLYGLETSTTRSTGAGSAPLPPPPPPVNSPNPPSSDTVRTVGMTVAGTGRNVCGSNSKRASPVQLTERASVTDLVAYVDGKGPGSGAQAVRAILYRDANGSPGARVAQSNGRQVSAGQPGAWVSFSFESPLSLEPGRYWIGLHSGASASVARYATVTSSGDLRLHVGDSYSDGAAFSFPVTVTYDTQLSAFLRYAPR